MMSAVQDGIVSGQDAEMQEYLSNIGVEYRFQCYSEKRPDGCHRLGEYLEQINRDFDKAGSVYQAACDDYKYPRSCFKIGNYKLMGKGCEQDTEEAVKYHKLACEGGHPVGCYQAAIIRLNGHQGARQDKNEAMELLRSGCEKEDGESCFQLSSIYLEERRNNRPSDPQNDRLGFMYNKKGCDLNHMYACANLFQHYVKGIGCKEDVAEAENAKRKALALKDLFERNDPGIVFGEG